MGGFSDTDHLWVNARLATFDPAVGTPYSAREGYALAVRGGVITAILPTGELAVSRHRGRVHDLGGRWVTPGFVDCHTHLVYGGSRAAEWEQRLSGVPYAEIARRGGGILSTVAATRAMTGGELVAASLPRLQALAAEGVTCVEIKSGYGLTLVDELKMLGAAADLARQAAVEVSPTLLAAHAVPPQYAGRADDYVSLIVDEIIPAVARARSAEAVDVFCESIAFSVGQCERVFEAAKRHGLAVKGHVEQLSNSHGAELVARYGGWSADHLEYLDDAGVAAMAAAGTVAVLLPGAFYFLREMRPPPVERLRAAGVPMAVGTDLNPGTSPFASIRLAMNQACVLFGLTPEEALAGVTREAARALGRGDRLGTLAVGKQADFLIWDVGHPAEIVCSLGTSPLRERVFRGGPSVLDRDMSVWDGRSDPADGRRAVRWHQQVGPLAELSPPGVALVGFPCDEGVQRNQGRAGASIAPDEIRKALANLAWHQPHPVYDAGDVACEAVRLEDAQEQLSRVVADTIKAGHRPLVLGGGHETAWGTFSGVARALPAGAMVGVINLDAHLDLRGDDRATSGTPFAQIARWCRENDRPFHYLCLGVSEASNTAALFGRARELGAEWRLDTDLTLGQFDEAVTAFVGRVDAIHLSLDLDVLPAATMPAVSAPAGRGVPLEVVEALLSAALRTGKVAAVDVVELNPEFDLDGCGTRVAARLVWQIAKEWPDSSLAPRADTVSRSETATLPGGQTMTTRNDPSRVVRAPRGPALSCKSWQTEAALRMLMNNLDPEVAERPAELVVYGGIGRAARNWECFDKIVEVLKRLNDDQTLLVQSGKPVGVFETHPDAPRVLLANSNLVPRWATWEHFHELDRKGLMMYGQMTAGSWIYIGSQGIVQGTYETFAAAARKHFDGSGAGRWILTGGLGGMGGAQPLAAVMAGFCLLAVECDESRIDARLRTRYLDRKAATLDEALSVIRDATLAGRAVSVGLVGNAADVCSALVERNITPDVVTDQTSAHDPLNGYLPMGWTLAEWRAKAKTDPAAVIKAAKASMAVHVRAMLALKARGAAAVDYGNNIRQMALEEGVTNAFDIPGFVPAYVRPLFCEGRGPFRWAALSGDPEDIARTDAKVKELIPDDAHLHNWLDMAQRRIAFQGLPARICWVGLKDRARVGLAFNEMVANGELKAPVVIGRDHLDSGSVASPNRETEGMLDGSDAVSDWPVLNALLNTASGATWVSFHHGGGVGLGFSQHAGLVIVCDGTPAVAKRIARVLRNDPGTGVMRHADAGYDAANRCARENGLDLPML